MTTYTATFADGTKITRKSDHTYTAAWRSTWVDIRGDGRQVTFTGFCGNPEKANPEKPAPFGVFGSAKQKAEAKRKNAEYIEACGYRVEIVPATAI